MNDVIYITSVRLYFISSLMGLCLIMYLAIYQYIVSAKTVAILNQKIKLRRSVLIPLAQIPAGTQNYQGYQRVLYVLTVQQRKKMNDSRPSHSCITNSYAFHLRSNKLSFLA